MKPERNIIEILPSINMNNSRPVTAKSGCWYEVNVTGSHHRFKHPTKKGRTTVKHPDKDIPFKTLKRIEEQLGLKFG